MPHLRLSLAALMLAAGLGPLAAQTPSTPAPNTNNGTTDTGATAGKSDPAASTPTGTAADSGGRGASAPNVSPAARNSETAPPLSGANSFTENQARERIEKAGFANVQGLKKDDRGIWRGQAQKDGKPAQVALDFRGNVVPQ